MIDAQNYRVSKKLKDGTAVIIRAIRPDDKNRIVEAFKNLEPESIYTRFFGFKSELTDEELKTTTEIDFEKTVALVVTIPASKGGKPSSGRGATSCTIHQTFCAERKLRSLWRKTTKDRGSQAVC